MKLSEESMKAIQACFLKSFLEKTNFQEYLEGLKFEHNKETGCLDLIEVPDLQITFEEE